MNMKDCNEKELILFLFGYMYAKAEDCKNEGLFVDMTTDELANYFLKEGINSLVNKNK